MDYSNTYCIAVAQFTLHFIVCAFATTNTGPVCAGSTFNLSASDPGVGPVTYSWAGPNGFTAIGQNVTNVPTPTGTPPFNYVCTATPTAAGSTPHTSTTVLTVNPIPFAVVTPVSNSICSGSTTAISLASNVIATSFVWTTVATNVSGPSGGTGSYIAQTLTSTGNSVGTVDYTITPSANGCPGTPIHSIISVNPAAQVNQPINQLVCNGSATTAVAFTTNNIGGTTTYSWTNSDPSIGIAASGTGNIAGFNAINTRTTPVIATITVTPTYTNGTFSCYGTSMTFTFTVNPRVNAPTGIASQTLCSGSIVANLTATGTTIKWYATATGGTTLASTTAIVNGTTYYASQTVNGCESTSRLAVTVSLNNPTVNASSSTICAGTNVALTANDNLTTSQIQTQLNNLVNSGLWNLKATYNNHYYLQYQTLMTWPQAKVLCEQNGGYIYCVNSQLENDNVSVPIANSQTSGNFLLGLYQDTTAPNYSEPSGGWKWLDGTQLSYTNWGQIEPNDNGGSENFVLMDWDNLGAVWNDITNAVAGTVIMEYPGNTTYVWSTGATTATINVTPTTTTQYWVDVTTNGVTCRRNITITVTPNIVPTFTSVRAVCSGAALAALPTTSLNGVTGTWSPVLNNTVTTTYTFRPNVGQCASITTLVITVNPIANAPTGIASQRLCSGSIVANLTVTGTGIKWYATTTGGTALASTTALVNGTTYYASQTVNGCESTTRLAVTVSLNNPTVSASANSVCAGQTTSLTANSGAAAITNFTVGSIGPSGGYVFYDQGSVINGWRYLEAAPNDNGSNSGTGCYCTTILNTSNLLGAGKTNTTNWINAGCTGGWFSLSQSIVINGLSQWFVPSKDELNLMYTKLKLNNLGNFSNIQYWTSSPAAYGSCGINGGAWVQNFTNGAQLGEYRPGYQGSGNLRLVRQFTTGTPFSSYFWSTGATTATINVTPTTTTQYWVDVTTNGVTCRKTITITVSPNIVPTFTPVASICSGSIIPVLPTLSTNNIRGTWSPAINNTATTTYTFTPTAGQCATTATMTIVVNPNVVPTFTSVPAICSGATLAALPTTSLNGISGTWSPALNNTATTTYTFRPNVGQCAVSTTMTIVVNAIPIPPVITRIIQPTCLSPTGSVYLSGLPTGIWTLNPGGIRGTRTTAIITRLNPGIANFTVTNSLGCTSNPSLNFVINPQPAMAVPLPQVVCNNSMTQPLIFTSNNTGGTTIYNWTNSDPSIGLSASGSGNIPSFIAVNYGTSPIVSTITVTPTFINGGISCTDASTTFTITVNPSGQVNQATSQVVCSGSTTTAVLFSTYNTSGTTTYSWVNSDPSIGLAATGTGDIPSFTAINTRTAPVISTISVFPSLNNGGSSCPGTPTIFTITVNPLGQVNQVAPQVVCNATSSAPVIFITNNTGGTSTYYWTNSNPTIGLVSSGTGNISSFTAINTGVLPVISTIKVTPKFTNAGLTCVGVPMITSVTVNPCVPIPTCGGSFYDNGGANANYANNTSSTTTICPNSIGDAVTVTFNSFSTEAGLDVLRIYDGNSPNSPLLGTLSGTIFPGSFTSSSANGCLTFVFTSDNTVTSAGWNASVTCNPRTTCSRPINLNATSISQSSAVLGWGQPANPNGSIASYWQVMAVPCGTTAPTTSSTGWRNTATNSYIFTGLNSATCYDFYVRAVCSSTDSSLISGPFNFHTLITNDEAIGAISVPVNQNTNCLQTVMGSLATATASQVDNSCGAALDDDDVWFKFTATAASHNISILGVNYTITPTNINYVLYTGTPGNLTQFGGCVLTNNYTANGLTIGQTYYIRAYSTATSAVTTYFELCIGTNVGNCSSALALCGTQPTILPNTVGVPTLPNPISPFSTSSSAVGCLLTAPSPTFFYLNVPTNGNYSFLIEQNTNNTFTGTGLDVDFVAWGPFTSTAAACAGISTANAPATGIACSYSAAFTENFTVNNAIAGEIYVLMITNFNGRKGFIRLTQTAGPVTSACCPRGNFTYSNTSYCQNGANPSPIFGNNANAGVFSAVPSNGLSINPTTGLVNLAASLPGTYVIHNSITSSGSCPADDDSWTIIITQQPSISMFYAGSPFCNSSNIGAVTLMGTGAYTGGTFSSQPGLSINSINGTITPSTSIPGTYTVTYTIPPSAGCASVVVTSTVVITRAPIAMFTYAGSPYCNNGINPSPIFAPSGIAGVFTSTSGLSINATTGVINLAISTPGTYTVTNTILASGGCPSVSASTIVVIIAMPTVNISYGRDYFCTNLNGVQPSLTGTGNYFGGTFIGSPGLSIDPFSGVIFPSSSTIGYHTVTYVIPSNGGCPLSTTTTSFAITPIPVATATPSQLSICSLGNAYIVLNSNAIGTTYTWNAVQTNVIGATSGTGTVINNVLRATGNTSGTVVYTITPFSGGCAGAPFTASVIVNPVPSVYVPANAYYSNNEIVPATVFSSNLTGVTYAWTNTNSSIGLPSSGTGSIPSFTAINLNSVPVTAFITVTPSLNGCVGTPRTYSITVAPSASTIGNISINSTRSSIDLFDTITVEVQLTNATDLYSLYMKLKGNLAVSQYLDYSGYTSSTLLGYPADVIATDPIVTNGEYDFGITKIGNVPGFTGSGLFYTFRFVTKNIPIPAGTNFCFYLDQISAYNPAGIACNLTNQGQYCFTFSNQTNVWPGDLNNNRSVTTADLLPIGYFYGSQGPTRPNANLQWTAQPAVLWGYNHSSINGNAYKVFADSNGDGVINNADQAAVGRNMNQVHYRIATPFRDNTPLTQSNGDLVVTPDITTVNALTSQTVTFSVSLNNTGGLNGLYGISVNLLFDDTVFDLSTATIDYTGSIFGIVGVDCLAIYNTTIDTESVGLTRFSNAAINGHGLLFKVTLQTRFPFVSSSNQTLVSSNVEAANNQFGDPLVIQDAPATNIVIINNNLGVNTAETKDFILYPNPANEVINIVMGTNASQLGDLKLKVINVLGQTVEKTNIQNTTREISTKNWGASGVYFVEISNSDDTVLMTKKVIVVRK